VKNSGQRCFSDPFFAKDYGIAAPFIRDVLQAPNHITAPGEHGQLVYLLPRCKYIEDLRPEGNPVYICAASCHATALTHYTDAVTQ
jgi:hypothetical protein